MRNEETTTYILFLILFSFIYSGLSIHENVQYDYSHTTECLTKPLKPQYNGGIAKNAGLNLGLKCWEAFDDSKIEHRISEDGNNKFIVAHQRNQAFHSPSQNFFLEKDKIYTFSAWLQVSSGNASIFAIFKTPSGFHKAGIAMAQSGCWSMLKGGLSVNISDSAQLYFESDNTNTEIWVDSISLQPFSSEQWMSHTDQSVEKIRKSHVKLRLIDTHGKPLSNTNFSMRQRAHSFQFGCASNRYILSNSAYQNWFASKGFTVTTFENEMKWYSTEGSRGREDYSVADSMLKWAKGQRLSVRGHNILWDDPKYQVWWLNSLSGSDFYRAVVRRIQSLVRRYAKQVIAWDAVNENLHHNYFESRLGNRVNLYNIIRANDYSTPLFLNEYNTIEEPGDRTSSPDAYLRKIEEVWASGYRGRLGIGLQGHFMNTPNLAYMRASLDKLATAGLPIWLTEVDVAPGPDQARFLDQVLREGHGHPAVKGIVVWSAWSPNGCYKMCLTDNNFRNLPTGDVVDNFFKDIRHSEDLLGITDDMGYLEVKLFNGDYSIRINSSNITVQEVKELSFKITDDMNNDSSKVQYIRV